MKQKKSDTTSSRSHVQPLIRGSIMLGVLVSTGIVGLPHVAWGDRTTNRSASRQQGSAQPGVNGGLNNPDFNKPDNLESVLREPDSSFQREFPNPGSFPKTREGVLDKDKPILFSSGYDLKTGTYGKTTSARYTTNGENVTLYRGTETTLDDLSPQDIAGGEVMFFEQITTIDGEPIMAAVPGPRSYGTAIRNDRKVVVKIEGPFSPNVYFDFRYFQGGIKENEFSRRGNIIPVQDPTKPDVNYKIVDEKGNVTYLYKKDIIVSAQLPEVKEGEVRSGDFPKIEAGVSVTVNVTGKPGTAGIPEPVVGTVVGWGYQRGESGRLYPDVLVVKGHEGEDVYIPKHKIINIITSARERDFFPQTKQN